MSSANLAIVKQYEAIIKTYAEQLISRGMYGFESANYVTVAEGNKGKRVLTEGIVGDLTFEGDTAYGFNPVADAFKYVPREIIVERQSVDLQFIPQQFEETYLGAVRRQGQNPGEDLPYQAWHLMKIMARMAYEIENGIHRGVKIGPLPNGQRRKLMQNLNGFDKVVEIELALGSADFTPYAVPGGAWSDTNTIDTLERMVERMSPDVRALPLIAYAPIHVVDKYRRNYREKFGKYTDKVIAKNSIKLDVGGDVTLVGLPGKGSDNRVMITNQENMRVDFDSIDDTKFINMEANKRKIDMWTDYKIGVNLEIVHNDVVSVCDIA